MRVSYRPRALALSPRRAEDDVYIPHPAPGAGVEEDNSKMGSLFSLLKTLIIPALISLILFLLVSYVLVPTWKRYRARYSQYLPLDTISTQTTSLRQRIQARLAKYLLPSSWRSEFGERYTVSAQDGTGSDFDEEDGEELYEVDDNRREALSLDVRRGRHEDDSRLSRDIEEGFKDDSEDEDDIPDERQGRSSLR